MAIDRNLNKMEYIALIFSVVGSEQKLESIDQMFSILKI